MFLHISCKKTRRYDMAALVQGNIEEAFGVSVAADLFPSCKALGELRNTATIAFIVDFDRFSAPSVESLKACLKYVNALVAIANRVPRILEITDKPAPDNVKHMFYWTDAFSGESAETSNFKLEIVACAFNAGAIMASLAASQARNAALGDAEIDSAARMYLRAAGFFDHICEMPFVVGGGTVDLHSPAQVACKFAMLANAQQCYYMQAAAKPEAEMSMESRAKIAAGTRDLYKVTAMHLDSRDVRGTSIAKTMLPAARALAEYYAAEAEMLQAEIEQRSNHWGVHVARLRAASEAITRAQQYVGEFAVGSAAYEEIAPVLNAKFKSCNELYAEALDRNNRIFYDSVPESIALVTGHRMVEPDLNISRMFSTTLEDPTLLPLVQLQGN
jgi:hypothetical protein